jgi:nitrogen fixation NifU-like protein
MSDLRELYQEVILDHYKKPRNFRQLPHANRRLEGYNPLCGDKVTVFLQVADGQVRDIGFQGTGCAISTASASLMTEALKGKPVEVVEATFRAFHELVTGQPAAQGKNASPPELGKLEVLAGVREFPVRVKCATLAWHTMRGALHGADQPVSTE